MAPPFRTRTRPARMTTVAAGFALVAVAGGMFSSAGIARGQSAETPSRRLTIPYLANKTNPADLDFAAAECDIVSNGEQMACRFRQVFLTTSSIDATTCVITTNGYERTFRRATNTRWVNESAPIGDCGIVETTTLEDGGGTRWTMTIQATATLKRDRTECRTASQESEVYDWLGVKRPLPCTSIQPGAIER